MAASLKAKPAQRSEKMEELLLSEVIIMTGGFDRLGHLLLTVPSETYKKLCSCYKARHMAVIIQYYLQLFAKDLRGNFAYFVNMSSWKREHVTMLLETLNMVEMENASNISVLYCIQPENRLVDKYLRKKLGFLPTKHPKDIPHFEAALFRGLSDISRLIDPSQVTEEFGGTLTYNHTLWCQFVQMEQNIETRIQQLMDKIPKAKDRMHMFLEYDIPETTTEISALREQLRAMYHDTMRDLNIEHLIDECNKELEHLYSPTKYAQIMHTPLFNKAKVTIGEYREKLIGNRSHMKWLWQESDARLRQAVHVKKYEQKADKVMKWLLIVGLPTVHQEPEIADSLNKAHILKINFETGFYAVAQDILSLAQMIQKKIDLILPPQHATYFTRMLHMFKQLDISIKHFQNVLKSKHKFYMNVYNLFTASHEIAQWYSETLSLLPTYLLRYDMNSDTGHPLVTVLHAWKNATDHHQKHHPIPHKNQLETLRDTVRLIADMTVRKQIRLLLYRTELLHKVLTWPELVTQKEVEDILRWKCMVESSSDEVSLLLVSQSFTFTNKEKPANEDSSDRQHSRTPKLRSQGYISDSDIDLFVSMRKQDTKEVCPIEQSKSGISLAKHHYPRIKSCISDDVSHDGDSALTRAEC